MRTKKLLQFALWHFALIHTRTRLSSPADALVLSWSLWRVEDLDGTLFLSQMAKSNLFHVCQLKRNVSSAIAAKLWFNGQIGWETILMSCGKGNLDALQ